jgi:hypothetical protein
MLRYQLAVAQRERPRAPPGRLAVILAGQAGPLQALPTASPPLAARFPAVIDFPGCTPQGSGVLQRSVQGAERAEPGQLEGDLAGRRPSEISRRSLPARRTGKIRSTDGTCKHHRRPRSEVQI